VQKLAARKSGAVVHSDPPGVWPFSGSAGKMMSEHVSPRKPVRAANAGTADGPGQPAQDGAELQRLFGRTKGCSFPSRWRLRPDLALADEVIE